MSFDATCPECEKPVRVRDELANKKIKCPKCGNKFVAKSRSSDGDDEGYAIEEEPRPTRKKRSKGRRDADDDDDDDNDDDDRPRRAREVPQVATPIAPLVWGILAILFPCPIVGFAIGGIAIYRANEALGELPAGRRGHSARRNMMIAIALGIIGCVASAVLSVVVLIIGR
jgi:DNA-directed RNA polymerase subunit RPC12/RpoP